jgi:hypothetical protein
MKNLFKQFKMDVLVLLGKCRCSGWKVYPTGEKCIGCGDCKSKHMKKRVLFYWEEAIGNSGAWTPVCNLSLKDLVDFDGLDDEEEREVQFKMFFMTDEELNSLPVE